MAVQIIIILIDFANVDGSCQELIVYGCTNSAYVEYNEEANIDNGTCLNIAVYGCISDLFIEFDLKQILMMDLVKL